MRHSYKPQMPLGSKAIEKIKFDIHSRHELVPILMALQHIYVHCKDMLEKIIELIAKDICGSNSSTPKGCVGLSHWENLVLVSLRLGCDLNYDQLSDLATNHRKVREMLGITEWDDKKYPRSTIQDNISQLLPETIETIKDMVVSCGHKLSANPLRKVRGDSFVLKKNIHYPTDSNLIVDGIRKMINLCVRISKQFEIAGWRQHEYLNNKAKRTLRKINNIARSKKADRDHRLKAAYIDLLCQAGKVSIKADTTIALANSAMKKIPALEQIWKNYISELHYFVASTEYTCQLARRRVFDQESIANTDKLFSHFEPDTELINRGKRPYPIEFGHRVMIVQDNAGFIIHSQMMDIGCTDEKITVDVMEKLQSKYNNRIEAASFDKGFWTPDNLEQLSGILPLVALPKKGKRSAADQEREGSKEFGKLRKWHAGVEAAIGALQRGNGMSKCRDKGATGYRRYIAMASLGRNLQTLGTILLEKERERQKSENDLLALVA